MIQELHNDHQPLEENTTEHPTIYKRTVTGAVQTWCIEQNGPWYRVASGQLDGAITRSKWTLCQGKNLGRSNETTPESQADAEIAAEYRKKLAQGRYHENIEDIDKETYFAPMLAHDWSKYERYQPTQKQFELGEVFAQPKLDGVRCIATSNGLWTRKGKPIVAVPHIRESLAPIFKAKPNLILDGELYTHDLREYLNRISGLVRKVKLSDEEMDQALIIEYHIYDCIGQDEIIENQYIRSTQHLHPDAPFSNRFLWLSENKFFATLWFDDDGQPHDDLRLVDTEMVTCQEELDDLLSDWLKQGYEGQIVRIDGQSYENKRSKYLLKRKEFVDEEFEIIGIKEGSGNRSGMAGYIEYVTKDGKEFTSGIAGGEDFYKYLLENADKYVGGQGNVRFFKYTEYGVPYLPVTHDVFENKRDL